MCLKGQKDKQWSTTYTYKTKDRVTRTPLKTRGELCNKRNEWMGLCLSGRSNHFWLSLIPRIPIPVSLFFGLLCRVISTIICVFVFWLLAIIVSVLRLVALIYSVYSDYIYMMSHDAWMGICLSDRRDRFWLSMIPHIPIPVSSFGSIIVLFSTIVLLFVLLWIWYSISLMMIIVQYPIWSRTNFRGLLLTRKLLNQGFLVVK
jgi:hypothetical protein